MSDYGRALRFEERLREACAERILPLPFGRALLNASFPRVWDLNLLRVERPEGLTVESLAATAERMHAEAGHAHRHVDVGDEPAGERLAPGFEALGWKVDRILFMGYRGERSRQVDTRVVREVGAAEVRPLRKEIAAAEPWAENESVLHMVLDASELVARAGSARHFAVRVDAEVAAAADLYSDGRTAQVEDVATRAPFRGRGLASAVVLHAVEEALAAGHDFVFLVADDADWPKELYARLGFVPLGRKLSFLRASNVMGPRRRGALGGARRGHRERPHPKRYGRD